MERKVHYFLSIIISFLFCLYYLFELAENKYQARSIFGFDNSSSNKNIFSNMSPLGGIVGLPTENNDLLTQINSGNFLRSVVLDLNLINDKEFFNVKKSSIELIPLSVKEYISKILIDLKKFDREIYVSKTEKIEAAVQKLKKNHLVINSLSTGGYEILVTTNNAKKSALIANKIAEHFLKIRLQNKIIKSEKALSYMSEKLNNAKLDMEIAHRKVETFALERNVLSTERIRYSIK